MDILYRLGGGSASDVLAALPDPPSYSAVRALLRVLEEKGHARHKEDGKRYVYVPTQARSSAARSALAQVVQTFFDGSVEQAVATLLSSSDAKLDDRDLERLARLIESARETEAKL
jgi:predicted transcriptional regulator